MAAPFELVQWILSNATSLRLQIENLHWIREVFPSLSDISVQIFSAGKVQTGFGFAADKDLALIKGFAEAAERAVVTEHKFPTSSGVAAHLELAAAKNSAREELIERDQILCHFYCNLAFREIAMPATEAAGFESMVIWYKRHKLRFSIYELGHGGVLFSAFGEETARPFGIVLGAARKSTMRESLFSAAIEATRQVAHLLLVNEPMNSITVDEFMRMPKPGFCDHGQLALNLDYSAKIAALFSGGERAYTGGLPHDYSIAVGQVNTKLPELANCPLRFARASSVGVQEIFLGPPSPEHLNLRRLSEFAGVELEYKNLQQLPHPFN